MSRISKETVYDKFGAIRDEYVLEADVSDILPAVQEKSRDKEASAFARFTRSGWFAACICAVVGVGVYAALLGLGKGWFGTPAAGTTSASDSVTEAQTDGTNEIDVVLVTTPETEAQTEGGGAVPVLCPEGHDRVTLRSHEDANCFVGSLDRYRCDACNRVFEVRGTELTQHEYQNGLCVQCGLNEGAASDLQIWRDGITDDYYVILKNGTETDERMIFPTVGVYREHGEDKLVRIVGVKKDSLDFNCEAYRGVKEVVIPEGYQYIGGGVFWLAENLKSVSLPSTLIRISGNAFKFCDSLEEIVIPEGCVEIGDSAFMGCSHLSSVHLPSSLKVIDNAAFDQCHDLKELVLPAGLTELHAYAMRGTAITELTLPDGIRSVSLTAFEDSHIRSLTIPESVTELTGCLYRCTDLETVSLPDSCREWWNYMFENLPSLKTINVPDSLTTIGKYAFKNCGSITEVIIDPNHPTFRMQFNQLIRRSDGKVVVTFAAG